MSALPNNWTRNEALEVLYRNVLKWWTEHKDDMEWDGFSIGSGEEVQKKIYEEPPEFVNIALAISQTESH